MFLLPEMCTPCFCIVALHGYELMLNFKLFKLLKVVSTPSSAGHYVHLSLQTQLTFLFVLCFFFLKILHSPIYVLYYISSKILSLHRSKARELKYDVKTILTFCLHFTAVCDFIDIFIYTEWMCQIVYHTAILKRFILTIKSG